VKSYTNIQAAHVRLEQAQQVRLEYRAQTQSDKTQNNWIGFCKSEKLYSMLVKILGNLNPDPH
jgi:hypothetical protein